MFWVADYLVAHVMDILLAPVIERALSGLFPHRISILGTCRRQSIKSGATWQVSGSNPRSDFFFFFFFSFFGSRFCFFPLGQKSKKPKPPSQKGNRSIMIKIQNFFFQFDFLIRSLRPQLETEISQ